jgi:hypothetical protein
MMKQKVYSILACCFVAALLSPVVHADIRQVRIAHFIVNDIAAIPDDFLHFAHSCGYNYVLVHGNDIAASSGTNDWRNPTTLNRDGSYDLTWAKSHSSLYGKLKDLFQRADKIGLKVIPCFNMSSRWAGHWSATNNNIALNSGTDNTGHKWSVPVFIEDANGMDKSFRSYLMILKKAFQDAAVSYPQLDYIHIGHDEVISNDGELLIARWNADEQSWIKTNGNNSNAYYKLMAEEAIRRVTEVKSILPNTKCIIWADAWDPESNGGNNSIVAWTSHGLVHLQTKNVIACPELTSLKNDLLLMPWQYETKYIGKDYNPEITLQYFKDNGFKVIIGTALDDIGDPTLEDSRKMLKKWVIVSSMSKFKDVVIGCCTHAWWDDGKYWSTSPRPVRFQILPEFAKEAKF